MVVSTPKLGTVFIAWMLPMAFIVHLLEEYFGGIGFVAWHRSLLNSALSSEDFIIINAIGLSLMVLFAVFYSFGMESDTLFVAFGTLVFSNGCIHFLLTLFTFSYSPGTISGIILYIPLGTKIFQDIYPGLNEQKRIIGVSVGIVVHVLVAVVAMNV